MFAGVHLRPGHWDRPTQLKPPDFAGLFIALLPRKLRKPMRTPALTFAPFTARRGDGNHEVLIPLMDGRIERNRVALAYAGSCARSSAAM
jgi:hypothetical protein